MELEETKKFNEKIELDKKIKIENEFFNIKLFSVMDYGLLKKITSNFSYVGQNCFYCWCKKCYSRIFNFIFNERVTKNLLGISSKNIYCCLLHLSQRILENFLVFVTYGNKEKKKALLEIFNDSPFLRNVKFIEKKKNENEKNNLNVEEKLSMITGNGCCFILKNVKKFKFLNDMEMELFNLITTVLKFIKNEISFFNDENLMILQGIINKIKNLFLKLFNNSPGLYFHLMFNHLTKMIFILKNKGISLFEIDNSSFELKNKIEKFIKNNRITKNLNFKPNSDEYQKKIEKNSEIDYKKLLGFKNDLNEEEKIKITKKYRCIQLMLFNLRELYLCNKFNYTIKSLPNFNRKFRNFEKKNLNTFSIEKFKELQISEEEFKNLTKDNFSSDYNYDEVNIYLKKLPTESDLAELPNKLKDLIVEGFFLLK
jgi:hypothetical protein